MNDQKDWSGADLLIKTGFTLLQSCFVLTVLYFQTITVVTVYMYSNSLYKAECPTSRISSICVTEGGTRARGRERASSNFTLRTMVFLKCSRASCRTDGSLPCTERTQDVTKWRRNRSCTLSRRLCTCTGWKMACSIERTSQKKKSQVSAKESSSFWPGIKRVGK